MTLFRLNPFSLVDKIMSSTSRVACKQWTMTHQEVVINHSFQKTLFFFFFASPEVRSLTAAAPQCKDRPACAQPQTLFSLHHSNRLITKNNRRSSCCYGTTHLLLAPKQTPPAAHIVPSSSPVAAVFATLNGRPSPPSTQPKGTTQQMRHHHHVVLSYI